VHRLALGVAVPRCRRRCSPPAGRHHKWLAAGPRIQNIAVSVRAVLTAQAHLAVERATVGTVGLRLRAVYDELPALYSSRIDSGNSAAQIRELSIPSPKDARKARPRK